MLPGEFCQVGVRAGRRRCGKGRWQVGQLEPAQRALTLAQSVEPGSFSSLHDDLVAGRRMELKAFHGFVVRRAAELGVPVPMSQMIYAILKPWAVRNQRARR